MTIKDECTLSSNLLFRGELDIEFDSMDRYLITEGEDYQKGRGTCASALS